MQEMPFRILIDGLSGCPFAFSFMVFRVLKGIHFGC